MEICRHRFPFIEFDIFSGNGNKIYVCARFPDGTYDSGPMDGSSEKDLISWLDTIMP